MPALRRWKCGECGVVHDHESEALDCCPPEAWEVYVCNECDKEYASEDDATACCTAQEAADETPNDQQVRTELEARGQLRLIG